MTHALEVCFGGPDKPLGHLRDVLAQRVADTPAGGRIDWVTYYFRDRQLAEELLRAHKRGVHVTLTLAATPRAADANQQVMSMLSGTEGLGAGLRAVSLPGIPAPGRPRVASTTARKTVLLFASGTHRVCRIVQPVRRQPGRAPRHHRRNR